MALRKLFSNASHLQKSTKWIIYRGYLSDSYRCEDAWNKRFESSLLKDLKPDRFYYDLAQKFKEDNRVAAIDADLYLNSLTGPETVKHSGDLEEILRFLRRSPETCNTLESTTHAAVRNLHDANYSDLLIKMIFDCFNYGIFLNDYLANTLMDSFLENKKHIFAARVAVHMMIQEEFENPITRSFMLLSALRYISEPEPETWVDYQAVPEPEEDIKVRVDYIRNEYFDDHFDLRDPNHLIGKTFGWVAPYFENPIKNNCLVLGWSLYEKWDKLQTVLSDIPESSLFPDVVDKSLASLEKCKDENLKASLTESLNRFKGTSEASLDELLETVLKENIAKFEQNDISKQTKLYIDWIDLRARKFQENVDKFRIQFLKQEIETKQKNLTEKEKLASFFDKQGTWEVQAYLKSKERQAYEESLPKEEKLEEDYVIPEVYRKEQ